MKILRAERDEKGAVLVIVALILVALMGFGALVIDGGNGRQAQSHAQTAADSAALAGAQVLSETDSPTSAEVTATSFAAQNGFASPTVDSPPPVGSGAYAGNVDCVYVSTSQVQPNYFAKAAGGGSITAGASAVACYKAGSSSTYGIIALDKTACSSFLNDASVTISGSGSIFVDSSCNTSPDAFNNSGGSLSVPSGSDINVVGGAGKGTCTNCTITTGVTAPNPADPLAAVVTAPPAPLTPVQSCGASSGPFSPGYYNCELKITSAAQFAPGDYNITGGIDFEDKDVVTLGSASGITYFTLGGVGWVDATNKKASFTSTASTGVLIYLKGTTGCPAFETSSNGDTYTLYPPASGIDKGVSVWVDKSVTGCDSESNPAVDLGGNSGGAGVAGTVYAPTGLTYVTANGGTDTVAAIVSDMVAIVGSTTLDLTVGQASSGGVSSVNLTQ